MHTHGVIIYLDGTRTARSADCHPNDANLISLGTID
jgi:hypothetical protein